MLGVLLITFFRSECTSQKKISSKTFFRLEKRCKSEGEKKKFFDENFFGEEVHNLFFVIGLSSNQVLGYAVVARHMFSRSTYRSIQLFRARNRANQGFSLSDCRPLKL